MERDEVNDPGLNAEAAEMMAHVTERLGYGQPDEWQRIGGGTINSNWMSRRPGSPSVVLRIGPTPERIGAGPSWMRGDGLACEQIVLDQLRPAVRAVPVPVAAGFKGEKQPWIVQEVIPGVPFAEVMDDMDEDSRTLVWRQLGETIRVVQQVPAPWFGTPTPSHHFADWSSMVLADVDGLLDDARRFQLASEPLESLRQMVTANAAVLDRVGRPRIVHSDLDPRHVFVVEHANGWGIRGIIDWEYARYADPMSESIVVELLRRSEVDPDRDAFLAGLGIDGETVNHTDFLIRQDVYRGIAVGWQMTDAVRLGG